MDATPIGAQHGDLEAGHLHRFPALGHAPEVAQQITPDGVVVRRLKPGTEALVEFIQRGKALDGPAAAAMRLDRGLVVEIMLIVDIADDLLKHVLNRDQA